MLSNHYIGRFAPSPTGPLHLGSLYAALASYLHARANQGKWLLRIDDIDSPREVTGAVNSICHTLEAHGLQWDDNIDYQSRHLDEYQNIIDSLIKKDLVYPCFCSRKTLPATESSVYSRTCLNRTPSPDLPYALRIKSTPLSTLFYDELQGSQDSSFVDDHGDFIIKRKDNITAYQLAVVIDDQRHKISHVVRGYDLLNSTPKQIFLQKLLSYTAPQYCHFPVIIDQKGNKLSKQKYAPAVSTENPQSNLFLLLKLLQQNPPEKLLKSPVEEIINWGVDHWQLEPLKKIRAISNKIY